MKQTRWLSEFRRLSEYTRLYPNAALIIFFNSERDERQMVYLRFLKVMFMVQFFHGIALVVCGALAVQYSERRTDIFKESHKNGADNPHDTEATLDPTGTDPSYYIGAFPVGILVSFKYSKTSKY